jgi:hypothetical protein
MIVSVSDFSNQAALTVEPLSVLQSADVITNGDYSQIYSDALSGQTVITFQFSTKRDVGYIALSGNFSTKDRITIRSISESDSNDLFSADSFALYSSDGFRMQSQETGFIDDSSLGINESRVMMYQADLKNTELIEVTVYGTGKLIINQIAMGDYYQVPGGGEQGGYSRPWSIPNKRGRTIKSLDNAPIALSYESRKISTQLTLPNNIMANFDSWYSFMNFAVDNTFYVLDDDNKFHSYAGFNAVPVETKAHADTRALGVSGIKFDAYAKSSGVFL